NQPTCPTCGPITSTQSPTTPTKTPTTTTTTEKPISTTTNRPTCPTCGPINTTTTLKPTTPGEGDDNYSTFSPIDVDKAKLVLQNEFRRNFVLNMTRSAWKAYVKEAWT